MRSPQAALPTKVDIWKWQPRRVSAYAGIVDQNCAARLHRSAAQVKIPKINYLIYRRGDCSACSAAGTSPLVTWTTNALQSARNIYETRRYDIPLRWTEKQGPTLRGRTE